MNRAKALQIPARAKPELTRRYGVVRLALFGSTVRDEARPDSDVDVVVSFDGSAISQRYFGVRIDTSQYSAMEAVQEIYLYLLKEGYLAE